MGIVSDTWALTRGRELEVLASLGITPPRRGHMCCPLGVHADQDPSWRWDARAGILPDSERRGGPRAIVIDLRAGLRHAAIIGDLTAGEK